MLGVPPSSPIVNLPVVPFTVAPLPASATTVPPLITSSPVVTDVPYAFPVIVPLLIIAVPAATRTPCADSGDVVTTPCPSASR